MTAQQALRAFARRSKLRVSSCDIRDANVGQRLSHQTRLWRRDRRVEILAADTLITIWIKIPDQQIVCSVNAPDRVLVLRDQLSTLGQMPVFGSRALAAVANEWLAVPKHAAAIESLRLSPRESLHFAANQLAAVIEPSRALDSALAVLLDIADTLPTVPPQLSKVNANELPPVLRPLVRYCARLAVGDDDLRSEQLASLTPRQVEALLKEVSPLLAEIDSYLDSFGDRPLTETAIRMGHLAEAVAELRAREA